MRQSETSALDPARLHRIGSRIDADIEAGRFIPGVDMPVWRIPERRTFGQHPDMLFGPDEAEQTRDLASEHPAQIQRLEQVLRAHLLDRQAPQEVMQRLRLW